MDMLKIRAELRAEREQIEEAITTLERIAGGSSKRRGRPPGSKMSASARKAQSVRMKKYWAGRRKQKST
jgi:hypothetical protein